MRETCLRVLAAGLMTGAIAAVVGMSALVGTPTDSSQPVAAAPPAEHHPIRIRVAPAPPRRNVVRRQRSPRTFSTPIQRAVISRRVVIIHTKAPRRQFASSKPKATPAPAPAPTSAETPPVQAQAATPSLSLPATDERNDGTNGHAYGHDKEHGRGHEKHED